ncbi:hypothetical protein HHI36_021166 [Cryptolaemus montrouzieri]|uniref:Uncharacterized protein n=1 Tax=Cryptolaemus montrouzieri TaxID=559131 RepID=A0ABD2MWT1_9CUCU
MTCNKNTFKLNKQQNNIVLFIFEHFLQLLQQYSCPKTPNWTFGCTMIVVSFHHRLDPGEALEEGTKLLFCNTERDRDPECLWSRKNHDRLRYMDCVFGQAVNE